MGTALRHARVLVFAALAGACGPATVSVESEACSATAPDGVCPEGEVCTDGACAPDCSIRCGGDCPVCQVGSGCSDDVDCGSGLCNGDICRGDHCVNGVPDGDETGVDRSEERRG